MGQLGVNREEGDEVMVVEVEEEVQEEEKGSEMMRWEKVLPRMALRVLLVEADDSTRKIISALLRKCNYKVAAISDGLKAWEALKRMHGNIDLILTELDLPSISGYALLTLIMEHDGCKNIPVIIMSSQDSVSMVLKCMLKGAADFLVKPVRKNELKNLWRHVWRRVSINAGHDPQNPSNGQCKVEGTFENNPATNRSSDDVSSSHQNSKLSEKAADAQSSCTTPYLEAEKACVENMQGLSPMKHREETGPSHKEMDHRAKSVKLETELALLNSDKREKATRLAPEGVRPNNEANVSAALTIDEDGSSTGLATENGSVSLENYRHGDNIDGHKHPEPSREAVDLIGRIDGQKCTRRQKRSNGELNMVDSTPELELSLRRLHDSDAKEVDERHLLNHSSASAFSWYSSNKKCRTFFPTSVHDPTETKSSVHHTSPWPEAIRCDEENKPNVLVAQAAQSEAVSESPQIGLVPLPGVMFDGGVWTGCGHPVLQLMCTQRTDPRSSSNSAFQREESPFLTSPSLCSDPGSHSSTQGCSTLGETTERLYGQAGLECKTRASVERHGYSTSPAVDVSGSSTTCNRNNSAYGSVSEVTDTGNDFASQQKSGVYGTVSEVTDGNATATGMTGTNAMEECLTGNNGSNVLDHEQWRSRTGHYSAEREAALAKFRLKRKGRCYEKKVRYQSRKRLAEQRPRVKGQFVRQVPTDQAFAEKP